MVVSLHTISNNRDGIITVVTERITGNYASVKYRYS